MYEICLKSADSLTTQREQNFANTIYKSHKVTSYTCKQSLRNNTFEQNTYWYSGECNEKPRF